MFSRVLGGGGEGAGWLGDYIKTLPNSQYVIIIDGNKNRWVGGGWGKGGQNTNCKTHVKSCVTVIDRIDLGHKLVHVYRIKFALKIQLCL